MATAAKMTGSVLGLTPVGTRAVMSGSTLTSAGVAPTYAKMSGSALTSTGTPPVSSSTRAIFSGGSLTSPKPYVPTVGRYRYNASLKQWIRVVRYRFDATNRLWRPVEWGATSGAAIPGGQGPSDAYLDPYTDGHLPMSVDTGVYVDTYIDTYSDLHSVSTGAGTTAFSDTYLDTYTNTHYSTGTAAVTTTTFSKSDSAALTNTAAVTKTAAATAYPDASTTGAKGTLTPYTGFMYITEPNTVVQNMDISHGMGTSPSATNVTIKNCRINGTSASYGIDSTAAGLIVQDCTIFGDGNTGAAIGDAPAGGAQFLRCDISGSQDGIKVSAGSLVQDCYIHDLAPYNSVTDTHNDGIQFQDYSNITIRHNRVIMGYGATSALLMGGGEARPPATNCLIENNLFGGGGWTVYGPQGANNPAGASSNIRIINNQWTTIGVVQEFGPLTSWEAGTGNVLSGNTWLDGPNAGQTIS